MEQSIPSPVSTGNFLKALFSKSFPFIKMAERTSDYEAIVSYIYKRPYDEESGDFVVEKTHQDHYVICMGDAMGHGREASALANEMKKLLSHVVKEARYESPAYLLKYCNFLFNFSNSGRSSSYGKTSDLAICSIDTRSLVFRYCSAKINVVLLRNGEALKLKNDRMPIGSAPDLEVYTRSIQLMRGDQLYLYTDGIPDQFGGGNDKKLGNRGFRKILESLNTEDISVIHSQLVRKLDNWSQGTDQTDDMTLAVISI